MGDCVWWRVKFYLFFISTLAWRCYNKDMRESRTERSRAYPGVPLDQCIKFAAKIRKALGKGEHDRPLLATALGMAQPTAIRPIAALAHFGLLERKGNRYRVSELAGALVDPLPNEAAELRLRALNAPQIYRELISRFEADRQIPEHLATILHRNFGITQQAAPLAEKIFRQSAQFAGLVDESGRFLNHGVAPTNMDTGSDRENGEPETRFAPVLPVRQETVDYANSTDHQYFRVRLTSGEFAELRIPSVLTTVDLAVLRKQLELLELQIKATRPNQGELP